MNWIQKLYYRIFYKDCEFDDKDIDVFDYVIFSNGERLHGIILGHNPIIVRDHWNKRHYMCRDCSKLFGLVNEK